MGNWHNLFEILEKSWEKGKIIREKSSPETFEKAAFFLCPEKRKIPERVEFHPEEK